MWLFLLISVSELECKNQAPETADFEAGPMADFDVSGCPRRRCAPWA